MKGISMKFLILVLSLLGSFFASSASAEDKSLTEAKVNCYVQGSKVICDNKHNSQVGILDNTNKATDYSAFLNAGGSPASTSGSEGNN